MWGMRKKHSASWTQAVNQLRKPSASSRELRYQYLLVFLVTQHRTAATQLLPFSLSSFPSPDRLVLSPRSSSNSSVKCRRISGNAQEHTRRTHSTYRFWSPINRDVTKKTKAKHAKRILSHLLSSWACLYCTHSFTKALQSAYLRAVDIT